MGVPTNSDSTRRMIRTTSPISMPPCYTNWVWTQRRSKFPVAADLKSILVGRSTRSLDDPASRCWLSQTKLLECQLAWAVMRPCSVAAVSPGIFFSNRVPPGLFAGSVMLCARCQNAVSRKWSQRPDTGVHSPDVSVLTICLGCDQWTWQQVCSFWGRAWLEKR